MMMNRNRQVTDKPVPLCPHLHQTIHLIRLCLYFINLFLYFAPAKKETNEKVPKKIQDTLQQLLLQTNL